MRKNRVSDRAKFEVTVAQPAERVLGRPRYWYMFDAVQRSVVTAVFDKLGPTYVRFFGRTPQVGESYVCGRLIEREDRPEQGIRARILSTVPLGTVQAMMKLTGSRLKVKGQWFEVISD